MAEQSGVSAGYVDSAVSNLRREMQGEIRGLHRDLAQLESWTRSEINRLEVEMREVGQMIVGAIDRQTTVLVGGVAATTAMVKLTNQQLEIQTESTLQIEVGKKLADASALKSKLAAFVDDIKHRFDKSIAGVAINRELYNLNFRKITDEYQSKVGAIGEHILQIKLEDIAPAVKAAEVTYEAAHSLPIEMDLKRLAVRSENLDETLRLLKSNRLDEVVSSLDTLESTLNRFSIADASKDSESFYCVEALVTLSSVGTKLLSGRIAKAAVEGVDLNLDPADESLSVYESTQMKGRVETLTSKRSFRDLSPNEIQAMARAVSSLCGRGLLSEDAKSLFEDFLGTGKLKLMDA
jgi:hypothetical protein